MSPDMTPEEREEMERITLEMHRKAEEALAKRPRRFNVREASRPSIEQETGG